MIRLLLADDQELIRSAFAALLALQEDFQVVASVGRGDEVVDAARAHQPDVALLDIEMPGIDGLAVAGAWEFVVKDAPPEQLAEAIRRVAAGERVVDPALAAESLAGGGSPLTARARDVLVASRPGASISEIAHKLFLSEGRCATTCRPRSPRRGRAIAPRPSGRRTNRAGCESPASSGASGRPGGWSRPPGA